MLRECNRLSRVVGTLGLVLGVGVVAPVPVQASPAGLAVQTASPGQLPDRWRLELEYFALLQQLDPVQSSVLGLPVAGWGLGPSSPVEVRAAADAWRALGVSANQLLAAEERSLDLALIAYDADRRVFDLDSLRVWERDPGYPFRAIAEGLNTILLNGALGPSERLARIVAREADIPRFLAGAAGHTGVPPRFLCEQAISEGEALSNFLLFGVQAAVATPEDSVLTQELVQVTARALDAVWAYRQHLIREVLPRSTGAFALGESLYAAQLRHVEGMTLPVAGLRDEASAEVERLSRRFSLACDRIAPGEGPWAALQRLAKDRPAPGNLVGFCRTTVRELHAHCRRSPLLPPPPAHGNLEVGPSPRFSSWANASLAVPGLFEDPEPASRFFITLPDRAVSTADRDAAERFLNRSQLRNLTAHETFPGHFMQVQYLRRNSSLIRRAITSRAFTEGWAHYGESLLLESGYRAEDAAFRVATLHSALRRAGRLRISLGLHTEGWTLEQAAAWLESECFLERGMARREAERAALQPLVSVYTLGRLELEKLRRELERTQGGFDAGEFHTALLELGAPPLYLVREAFGAPTALRGRFLD